MILILLLISIVCLYFGQDILIYQNNFDFMYEEYPENNAEGMRNPKEKKMNYEEITVMTEDNVRLSGWFIHHDASTKGQATIIYMHETWGNIGYRLPWAENIYHNLGVNIVLVGYRGYGHSEGEPSEKGLEKDARAIIKWTLENKKVNPLQVYIFGAGLGGAVGVYGTQFYQNDLRGLILENTFSSMAASVDDTNWLFRLLRPIILANYWPSDERIKNITTPILFISGNKSDTNDDMHRLKDLATKSVYTDFLEVPNGNKNDTWRVGAKSYLLTIDNFILKTRTPIIVNNNSTPGNSTKPIVAPLIDTNTTITVNTTVSTSK